MRTTICDVSRLLEHKTHRIWSLWQGYCFGRNTFAIFAATDRFDSAWACNIPYSFLTSAWQCKSDR